MRDHVTEERISAYADGELEGDELELVERLLAESAEYRQLLAEFQSLRASMRSLPSVRLPADFHTRVVDRINETKATPSKDPSRPRDAKPRPWRRVFYAAASLAAAITLVVMLRPPSTSIDDSGSSEIVATPVALPVYLQKEPDLVMVYDVSVTPTGQKNETIDKLLKNLGIGIDPAMRLDDDLEKDLMVIRDSWRVLGETEAMPYKSDPAKPKSGDDDKVEMIYVAGTLHVLDRFYIDLFRLSEAGEEVSHVHTDLLLEPNKLGVMHRLHDSAREHFAHNTTVVPSDAGQAFRLAFRFELTSSSVPGAATFPVPTIRARSGRSANDGDVSSLVASTDPTIDAPLESGEVSRPAPLVVGGRGGVDVDLEGFGPPNPDEMQPGHILLILRHVGANAAAEE
ncbi:MAG: RseA family anti-sigma factor, partial [Pirellulaceae bacterium]